MALTFSTRHWLTGIALGCAFIGTSLLPPPDSRPRKLPFVGGTDGVTGERINQALRRATDRLSLLERRDSLQRLLAGRELPIDRPTLLFQDVVPAPLRSVLSDMIAEQWKQITPSSGIPVVVAVALDTASPRRNAMPEISHILPDAFDRRACVSIIRFDGVYDATGLSRMLRSSSNFLGSTARKFGPRMLGPCGYYAAFGMPGPEVGRWLAALRYDIARNLDWTSAPSTRGGEIRSPLVPIFGSMFYDMAYNADVRMLSCVTGKLPQCEAVALDTGGYLPERRWSRDMVTAGSYSRWSKYSSPLGSQQTWYISDMVHDLGKEKFARFWRSTQPVSRAFTEASGMSLAEWTRQWLAVDGAPKRIVNQPGLQTLGMSMVVVLTGVLGTLVVMQRRRVV
jgi:hypothetical protein